LRRAIIAALGGIGGFAFDFIRRGIAFSAYALALIIFIFNVALFRPSSSFIGLLSRPSSAVLSAPNSRERVCQVDPSLSVVCISLLFRF
jgi:hypothetical protein